MVEHFNRTLKEEFFSLAYRRKFHDSADTGM
jgi:hypothetical protein